MMIYVSLICFHIKTHHIGKFEENLRPCVNSLYYRMLHDNRELINSYKIDTHPFKTKNTNTLKVHYKSKEVVFYYISGRRVKYSVEKCTAV